jgi:ATP-dependent DNA helicase PIF1
MFGSKKTIAVTSTTGISAILIGGTTLHSYLGIGLGQGTAKELADDIYKRAKARQKWVNLDVLIVDEVSMLSPELFDKLDYIGKTLRGTNRFIGSSEVFERPFGGIQLVLCGDFLQLPVVGSDYFCFESES